MRQVKRRKLIVVSNRLPTRLEISGGKLRSYPSAGGLVSALAGVRSGEGFAWVGWPGITPPRDRQLAAIEVLARDGQTPVFLTRTQEERYYLGACNDVLWPLFHYFTDRISFSDTSWESYVEVNRMFAEAVLELCEPDTRVWVHDFHLMLVPSMLRERAPSLEIGFFLHTPFPSSEIYRLLPTREEVLRGVLGADYIGFHTNEYALHFRTACLRILGLESEPASILYEGRCVGIGTDPIGVDVERFRKTLDDEETEAVLADLKRRYGNRKVILGVERLDYTKGIPLKLQAFQRFLDRDPRRAKEITLLQVVVPSRSNHPEYRELKSEVEKAVGRINGKYGGPGVTPVEYLYRSLTPAQLVAMYRFADVGFVTPVRDGMNLIAQEFVLCQGEAARKDPFKGILVLSEFAGAAHYLARSILVNPWSIEETADALETAVSMSGREKRERMRAMVDQVVRLDCRAWAHGYLTKLGQSADRTRSMCAKHVTESEATRLQEEFRAAHRRILVLDYHGTLRELARSPDKASPTLEILELLADLGSLPDTQVHLISGRTRETMQEWFDDLPIYLCAEHGYSARPPGGEWSLLHDIDLSWIPGVDETLARVTSEVPGTIVERKNCAIAWHYRMADLDYGEWRARELLSTLEETLANEPVEVVPGHRMIEVRASGVNKGAYVSRVVEGADWETFVLCASDDRTEADMYRAPPKHALSIHVVAGHGAIHRSVEAPSDLRQLLRGMLRGGVAAKRPQLSLR
jgi:trehalose 6-phosphate synthase/phosphatase